MLELAPEILTEIYYELFKEKHFIKQIYKLAFSGKTPLKVLETILSSAKVCCISDDAFIIKFKNNELLKTRYLFSDFFVSHFFKFIGSAIEILELDNSNYEGHILFGIIAIIDAVCEAKKLKKLSINNNPSKISQKIVASCSKTLKILNTDATTFLGIDTSVFDLDSLHIFSLEPSEFRSILKQKCFKTSSLSFAFLQNLTNNSCDPAENLEWSTLIDVFEGIENPSLNSIKHLKLFTTVDGTDDEIRFEEVALNISETFPSLQNFEICQSDSWSALPEIEDMLFVIDATKLCYFNLFEQILDSSFGFSISVKWRIIFEGFYTKNDCITFIEKVCQVFDDFEFFETDKTFVAQKKEEIAKEKFLEFSVEIEK